MAITGANRHCYGGGGYDEDLLNLDGLLQTLSFGAKSPVEHFFFPRPRGKGGKWKQEMAFFLPGQAWTAIDP